MSAMSNASGHESQLKALGLRLREGRNRAGISMAKAAEKSGLSKGFISLIENGKTDATVGRLSRLLTTYGLHMSDVMDGAGPNPAVAPAGEVRRSVTYESDQEGVSYRIFTGPTESLPVHVEITPGGGWSDLSYHAGQESIYALQGVVELVAGDAVVALSSGESFTIGPGVPHRLRNLGASPVELFVLVDEPDVDIRTLHSAGR